MNHFHDLYLGKFLEHYQAYNVNTERYLLCLDKKLRVATYRGCDILSKRTEIVKKCRRGNKLVLANHNTNDKASDIKLRFLEANSFHL